MSFPRFIAQLNLSPRGSQQGTNIFPQGLKRVGGVANPGPLCDHSHLYICNPLVFQTFNAQYLQYGNLKCTIKQPTLLNPFPQFREIESFRVWIIAFQPQEEYLEFPLSNLLWKSIVVLYPN